MKKGFLNLVLFLLICNSVYNILINLTLPPLCSEDGEIITVDKCRYYDLSSDKVDSLGQPLIHEDSKKYFKSIRAWFIPEVIFNFLMLSIGISYFVVPQKHKKLFAYIVVGASILNSLIYIIKNVKEPPMCSQTEQNTHEKCVNYTLYTNMVDLWAIPIKHYDSYDFHQQRMGLKLGEIIVKAVILAFSIFTLIKK
tara:strand:+ start:311 stop:898 length:588 start_codon:yes stop_codon:yes gene_type:complete